MVENAKCYFDNFHFKAEKHCSGVGSLSMAGFKAAIVFVVAALSASAAFSGIRTLKVLKFRLLPNNFF